MPTPTDLLQSAVNGDVLSFTDTFAQIMGERIKDRMDDFRQSVAKDIYSEDEVEDSEDVGEAEFEDNGEADLDSLEDDDDDLEFDDEDLDLDLDLEDLSDDQDA
jgi:hypothetical protein